MNENDFFIFLFQEMLSSRTIIQRCCLSSIKYFSTLPSILSTKTSLDSIQKRQNSPQFETSIKVQLQNETIQNEKYNQYLNQELHQIQKRNQNWLLKTQLSKHIQNINMILL